MTKNSPSGPSIDSTNLTSAAYSRKIRRAPHDHHATMSFARNKGFSIDYRDDMFEWCMMGVEDYTWEDIKWFVDDYNKRIANKIKESVSL